MALADIMERHLGHLYVFGGAPGVFAQFGWDCSSAVNWCASRDGRAIPGYGPGKYEGLIHGPSTFGWAPWAPQHMNSIDRSRVRRNDICLWPTHMGVAVSNTWYVSAACHGCCYLSRCDTIVQPIHGGGPFGETASFWRYAGPAQGGNPGPGNLGPTPGLNKARLAWWKVVHMTGPWASDEYRGIVYIQRRAQELRRK